MATHWAKGELAWHAQPRQAFVAGFPLPEAESFILSPSSDYLVVYEKADRYYLKVRIGEADRIIAVIKEHNGNPLGVVTDSSYRPVQAIKIKVPKYYVIFKPGESYEVLEHEKDKITLAMPAFSPVESYAFPKSYFVIKAKAGASKSASSESSGSREKDLAKVIAELGMQNECADIEIAEAAEDYACLIEGDLGSGTGFLMREGNNVYCYTAFHVIDGMRSPDPVIRLLNGTTIKPLTLEVANKRDIARMLVANCPPALAGYRRPKLDEELYVKGNSQGRGRITTLDGKVTGISEDEVETNAGFTSGNSGSALVAKSDGLVIGVASYIEQLGSEFDLASKGTRFAKPRRVAEIVDSDIEWIPADLKQLHNANRKYHEHELFLAECTDVMMRIANSPNQQLSTDGISNSILRGWINNRNQQVKTLTDNLNASNRSEEDVQVFANGYLQEVTQQHAYFRRLCQSREAQVRALRNYPGTEFQKELTLRLLGEYEQLGDINDYILKHTSDIKF
ncbi:serine protease [Rubellicoccus peritrichatus]|uniref:Serine protease n=1 Tax=Rubellicoccus peritrichatus TaxID=3080537 RepID=A0AAQ3LAU8_9BACT|nr:serine protease [Puniceicoccus sp. CR14]WOO42056.1 serine protease [Puniceicoccus sp. CR14]